MIPGKMSEILGSLPDGETFRKFSSLDLLGLISLPCPLPSPTTTTDIFRFALQVDFFLSSAEVLIGGQTEIQLEI